MSETLTCSLCGHDIPETYLRQHKAEETKELVAHTIKMIQDKHPDWVETDGTCQKCWDLYREL